MSTTTIKCIKKLVAPYMATMEVHPTEDGPRLAGMGNDGAWHDFLTVDEALKWANERYCFPTLNHPPQ